ncbi:MAG: efflux transporter periplasmic adaptor subunit [Lacunisphaera sp.]|nr:efflux transporter periplasmic adaptor subunit [Lacunisphaera sp.]
MNIFALFPLRLSLIVMLGLAAASCQRQAPSAPPPVPVTTTRVTQRNVPLTRTAVGLVQPLHTVALQSQVDGVIAQVHFTEGDEVKAGALLVTLDQRPFQSALQAAEAQLAQARANADKSESDRQRYAKLHEEKAISDAEMAQYDTAAAAGRATAGVQEAAVTTAKLNLAYTEIHTPIEGRTSRLAQREGALVKAGDSAQPLLTINQLAPIGVAFALPESDLGAIRAAFSTGPVEVTARIKGDGPQPGPGRLDFVDNTVGTATGTVALRATFANQDDALWPGQFVEVVVRVGELPDALLVPGSAIVPGQAGDQIFVVKPDGTADVRPVHTGATDGDDIVVLDAVKAGETVVTDGQLRLVPGSKVTVKTPGEPPAGDAGTKPKGHKQP